MSFFSDVERELVLLDRVPLAQDVLALELASSNGRPLPAWSPGDHIDLQLAPGVERQYSLCGDPHDRERWRVAVLHEEEGRGGSIAAHDLATGSLLRARGPRSNFALDGVAAGDRATFVAGGIGITPILPMIHAAEALGVDWTLHYCGRQRSRMAFAEELLARHPERVRLHVSADGSRLDVLELLTRHVAGDVWACGPAPLLDALTEAAAQTSGVAVHTERFTPRELTEPVWQGSFEVELASSGAVIEVPPELSVLEALEDNDVLTVSSCREGTCGTCETVVLEGEVDHRDSVLTAAEQAQHMSMMTCVSRAACPRLLLDL